MWTHEPRGREVLSAVFVDVGAWTVGLSVEIRLRFQIPRVSAKLIGLLGPGSKYFGDIV